MVSRDLPFVYINIYYYFQQFIICVVIKEHYAIFSCVISPFSPSKASQICVHTI